jgi:hypothetical protein
VVVTGAPGDGEPRQDVVAPQVEHEGVVAAPEIHNVGARGSRPVVVVAAGIDRVVPCAGVDGVAR